MRFLDERKHLFTLCNLQILHSLQLKLSTNNHNIFKTEFVNEIWAKISPIKL